MQINGFNPLFTGSPGNLNGAPQQSAEEGLEETAQPTTASARLSETTDLPPRAAVEETNEATNSNILDRNNGGVLAEINALQTNSEDASVQEEDTTSQAQTDNPDQNALQQRIDGLFAGENEEAALVDLTI